MKFDYKDWFHWTNLIAIIFFIIMYISVIPTLQRWSWGFWSYEYFAFTILAFVYFMWYWSVHQNRRFYRLELMIEELNKTLPKKEEVKKQ